MSDGELLANLGTDGQFWAQQFIRRFEGRVIGGRVDEGLLIGWFANAIEAGRTAGERAGYERARREIAAKLRAVADDEASRPNRNQVSHAIETWLREAASIAQASGVPLKEDQERTEEKIDDERLGRYRLGRKLSQTIYEQAGDTPDGADRLLAFAATPQTAVELVDLLNRAPGICDCHRVSGVPLATEGQKLTEGMGHG